MKTTPERRRGRLSARFSVRSGIATAVSGVIVCGLAACGASLPSGGFVTGSVGEQGANVAELGKAPRTLGPGPAPKSEASTTGAAANPPPKAGPAPRQSAALAELARSHAAEPRDAGKALAYSRALKREGKRNEALAVLDATIDANSGNQSLHIEQGLQSLELGQAAKAEASLKQAAAGPDKDWRINSGLGVAVATQGRHREAQAHFAKALELSPNNASVLNNMAVSLLLDRKVDQAEAMLRRASKDGGRPQQVTQNLALARAIKTAAAAEASDTTAQ